jgi:hypothetical protein
MPDSCFLELLAGCQEFAFGLDGYEAALGTERGYRDLVRHILAECRLDDLLWKT